MKEIDGVTNIRYFREGDVISFKYQNTIEYFDKIFHLDEEIIIRAVTSIYPRMMLKRDVNKQYPHMFYKPLHFCVGTPMQLEIFQRKNNHDIRKWFLEYGLPNLGALYYWEKYSIFPFGEYEHGNAGYYDSITEEFNINKSNVSSFIELVGYRDINLDSIEKEYAKNNGLVNLESLLFLSVETRLDIEYILGGNFEE